MIKNSKTKSRILGFMHETASDLHRLGFIDKRKMRKFDELCLDPKPDYDSEKKSHGSSLKLHNVQVRKGLEAVLQIKTRVST